MIESFNGTYLITIESGMEKTHHLCYFAVRFLNTILHEARQVFVNVFWLVPQDLLQEVIMTNLIIRNGHETLVLFVSVIHFES